MTPRTLGLLAAVIVLAACATERRVEEGLERALAELLGPANRYQVDVDGLSASTGQAELVRAEGVRVRPGLGPVVDRLELELRNVRYDRALERLVGAESIRATAWVRAADLEDFLEREERIRGASVVLSQPNQARVRFRPNLGFVPLDVTAEVDGTIEGRGSELHFVVADARAAGFRVDAGVAEGLTRAINPIVDLSYLPLRLEVTSVRVEQQTVRVDAIGDVTTLVARFR